MEIGGAPLVRWRSAEDRLFFGNDSGIRRAEPLYGSSSLLSEAHCRPKRGAFSVRWRAPGNSERHSQGVFLRRRSGSRAVARSWDRVLRRTEPRRGLAIQVLASRPFWGTVQKNS